MELKVRLQKDHSSATAPVIIRKATRSDFPGGSVLQELEFALHKAARPDYFKSQEISYTEDEFEDLLSHPCPICQVAVHEEKVVGLCFGTIEKSPEYSACKSRLVAFIQDIVTLPEYRGQGIATTLMSKAREQALREGAVSMELCVWNFNQEAIQFYKTLGMRVQYCRMEEELITEGGCLWTEN